MLNTLYTDTGADSNKGYANWEQKLCRSIAKLLLTVIKVMLTG